MAGELGKEVADAVNLFVAVGGGSRFVGLALDNSHLVKVEGKLVPGVLLLPDEADQLAESLMFYAEAVRKIGT